jgi:hypothetical protein
MSVHDHFDQNFMGRATWSASGTPDRQGVDRLETLFRSRTTRSIHPAGEDVREPGSESRKSRLPGVGAKKPGLPTTLRCHFREHLLVAGAGFEPATFGL